MSMYFYYDALILPIAVDYLYTYLHLYEPPEVFEGRGCVGLLSASLVHT